ncbi:methyltransferase domain-containing protein [Vulcanisaeta souniana]|uniref:methyltransferase domain-containing protein n=1 Tax=Vulcanisaeta souniana TaxID=164452 RepID=UPI000A8634F2|nr:methyltransferase domain-containing protein [Vulcanisaeta souniana]
MRIAISVSNGFVSGPGEGDEVWIIEVEDSGNYKLIERYENPARYAQQVRGGVFMLRSLLDRGVNTVILSEIGPPGYRWAVERGIKIYIFEGRVEDAIKAFIEGKLTEAQGPTHGEHHGGHGHHGSHHRHAEDFTKYDFLKPYVSNGMVIADLGCGDGYYCNFFKDYASRLYCVDVDEVAIEDVRRKFSNYSNVTILNEDVTSTSIPSNSVDLAFMSNVFHDIEDKEAAVREISRILRPGGKLLIIEFKEGVVFGPPRLS